MASGPFLGPRDSIIERSDASISKLVPDPVQSVDSRFAESFVPAATAVEGFRLEIERVDHREDFVFFANRFDGKQSLFFRKFVGIVVRPEKSHRSVNGIVFVRFEMSFEARYFFQKGRDFGSRKGRFDFNNDDFLGADSDQVVLS